MKFFIFVFLLLTSCGENLCSKKAIDGLYEFSMTKVEGNCAEGKYKLALWFKDGKLQKTDRCKILSQGWDKESCSADINMTYTGNEADIQISVSAIDDRHLSGTLIETSLGSVKCQSVFNIEGTWKMTSAFEMFLNR